MDGIEKICYMRGGFPDSACKILCFWVGGHFSQPPSSYSEMLIFPYLLFELIKKICAINYAWIVQNVHAWVLEMPSESTTTAIMSPHERTS